jgi:hypothetical protein
MNKRRAFAWAKYFELANRQHEQAYDHYTTIREVITNITNHDLTDFVKKQLIDMGAELKKTWECPICLDFIAKENLDITPCGHYYCKGCLEQLKKRPDEDGQVKCGVCRHKLYVNPEAEG